MPKYYFDIHDGTNLHQKDRVGAVFADDGEAVRYAVSIAEGLRDDEGFAGFHIDVRDSERRQVGKVPVSRLH